LTGVITEVFNRLDMRNGNIILKQDM